MKTKTKIKDLCVEKLKDICLEQRSKKVSMTSSSSLSYKCENNKLMGLNLPGNGQKRKTIDRGMWIYANQRLRS